MKCSHCVGSGFHRSMSTLTHITTLTQPVEYTYPQPPTVPRWFINSTTTIRGLHVKTIHLRYRSGHVTIVRINQSASLTGHEFLCLVSYLPSPLLKTPAPVVHTPKGIVVTYLSSTTLHANNVRLVISVNKTAIACQLGFEL
jgi:hypothetical protein